LDFQLRIQLTINKLPFMSLRNPERGWFTVKGLIFSLGLIASFIFVGSFYTGLIRPIIARGELASSVGLFDQAQIPPLMVLLNGWEQQICLSLFMWALMILAYKLFTTRQEASALGHFIPRDEGGGREPFFDLFCKDEPITRAEAGKSADIIEKQSYGTDLQHRVLPYILARGLERYQLTGNSLEVTETVSGRLDIAAEQQDSELSILRYIAWAIPSIGFIGTVRGIGLALQRADEALEGDISGVTSALGLAFNSTLIALMLSIVLMLGIHLIASQQEGLIIRLQTFCRERFIDRLRDKSDSASPLPSVAEAAKSNTQAEDNRPPEHNPSGEKSTTKEPKDQLPQ
jgi:biopolymer transport protein ExbB/TolQ